MSASPKTAGLAAFRVLGPEGEVGLLGEGRGPFITAVDSDLPYPVLAHARFTSVDAHGENEISSVLVGARTFDDAKTGLERRGLRLVPVEYGAVFQDPADATTHANEDDDG